MIAADPSDKGQALRGVTGSSIVFLLVGLKYQHTVWQEM
jgi:hypothetical protein